MLRYHQHRHRSHTINTAKMTEDTVENRLSAPAPATTSTNLCGYDSYLHATICAAGNSSGVVTTTTPAMGVATPMRKKCNQKLIKSRLRQQQQFMAQQHQIIQQHQITEQHQQKKAMQSSELRKVRRAQKLIRSNSKEELMSKEKVCVVENLLTTDDFNDKLKITEEFAEKFVESSKGDEKKVGSSKRSASSRKSNELILEYASIPVTAEPGECENLIKSNVTTPNDEPDLEAELSKKSSPTHSTPKSQNSSSTVHRYVHEHIHHHYHHFENEENII